MAKRKDELTTSERIFVRIALLQTVLAVAGIVTGSIALYAGLTQADAARKQQEASVWPMLQMAISDYDVETRQRILKVFRAQCRHWPGPHRGFSGDGGRRCSSELE